MTREQRAAIARSITTAEDGTTGRIAVRVVPDSSLDAFDRARQEFGRVGLHRHAHANAVLILVAPKARRFAVIGDRELHERVGDAFWETIVAETQPYFARGATAEGIIAVVTRLGGALHAHFAQPVEGRHAERA